MPTNPLTPSPPTTLLPVPVPVPVPVSHKLPPLAARRGWKLLKGQNARGGGKGLPLHLIRLNRG